MPIPVTFSGQTFSIPSQAERNWAVTLNAFFQGIAANALPRSGGSFTLAADLDLGSSANLIVKGLVSKTAGAAATGYVRLANNEGLGWRNAAGSGDLILKVNGTDQLEYNGVALASAGTAVTLTGAQTVEDKNLIKVTGITLLAGATVDWAPGNTSIGASLGFNTLTIGGSSTTVLAPGILRGNIVVSNSNTLFMNAASLQTGADWKIDIARPLTGMSANAVITLPNTTTILVGRDTTDTFQNKLINGANNTLVVRAASDITGQLPIANGGTGQATANAALNALLPSQASANGQVLSSNGTSTLWTSPLVNPMSDVGDLIVGGTSGAATKLAPNTTTTRKFLAQTGTGSAGQTPVWTDLAGSLPGSTTGSTPASTSVGYQYSLNNSTDYTQGSPVAGTLYDTGLSIASVTPGIYRADFISMVGTLGLTSGQICILEFRITDSANNTLAVLGLVQVSGTVNQTMNVGLTRNFRLTTTDTVKLRYRVISGFGTTPTSILIKGTYAGNYLDFNREA